MNEKAKPCLVSISVPKEIEKSKAFSWAYEYVSKDLEARGYGNHSADVDV